MKTCERCRSTRSCPDHHLTNDAIDRQEEKWNFKVPSAHVAPGARLDDMHTDAVVSLVILGSGREQQVPIDFDTTTVLSDVDVLIMRLNLLLIIVVVNQ